MSKINKKRVKSYISYIVRPFCYLLRGEVNRNYKHDILGEVINIEPSYGTDQTWLQAKAIAKQQGQENNWIEVMSYYQELGGKHIAVFCGLEEGDVRRLIVPTDSGEHVLMLRDTRYEERETLVPYEDVLVSTKEFVFTTNPEPMTVTLPDGETFLGDTTIEISNA